MSVKKTYLKSKPLCKVTFKLTKEQAQQANSVHIVGDFNQWDTTALPMKKLKNGSFSSTVDLEIENNYQFRYLLDNEHWENDWQADGYIPSPVSHEENSIVCI